MKRNLRRRRAVGFFSKYKERINTMDKEEMNERFRKIFEKSDKIINNHQTLVTASNMTEKDVNLSTIASILIGEAGRWCKTYASDFIITWDTVREAVTKHVSTFDECETDTIVFGFRLHGVDHDSYVNSRIEQPGPITNEYISIMAVQVSDYIDEHGYKRVSTILKDIKCEVESENYRWRNNL